MPTLRRLGREDAEQYRSLRLESLERHPQAYGSSWGEDAAKPLASYASMLEHIDDLDHFGRVVGGFSADELVGIAGFFRQSPKRLSHKGVLCGMYVRDDMQGTGLARELVNAVFDHAQGKVELIQLSVVKSNDRACRFYENCGFEVYGTEPRALKVHDRYFDELLMWRPVHS